MLARRAGGTFTAKYSRRRQGTRKFTTRFHLLECIGALIKTNRFSSWVAAFARRAGEEPSAKSQCGSSATLQRNDSGENKGDATGSDSFPGPLAAAERTDAVDRAGQRSFVYAVAAAGPATDPSVRRLCTTDLCVINMLEWQSLKGSAILRRHAGDLEGAIAEFLKAIAMTRPLPNLAQETAISLNYLADMYIELGADAQAEQVLRESIELARPRFPLLLAADLWILAEMQNRQGMRDEAVKSAEESRRLCEEHDHPYGVRQAEDLLERIRVNPE
jgi:tetratricopeptide (TPR) repeat protein